METLAKRFGRRIKELRKAKSLTQEELGQAAGVDYKYLGEVERGVKTSSFSTIEKLAKALGVDYYELFLPTFQKAAGVESEIAELLADSKKIDLSQVEEFLRGLRSLVRKLDRRH